MNRHRNPIAALRRLHPWLALATALAVLPAWSLRAQSGGGYDLTWNRAGGGTAAPAAGGGFELNSSVGQSAAGFLADGAGDLALTDGFGAIYAVQTFSLELRLGWNLISVPLYPLDPYLAEVLPSGMRGPLWEFTPEGYQPVLSIEPLRGYWVWSGRSASRTFEGVPVETPVRALEQGWNLVGPTGLPPYAALALPLDTTPAGALAGPTWAWDPRLMASFGAGRSLALGRAYWVYASVPARIRLGP